MPAETPGGRQPLPIDSHRLHPRGQRSNRYFGASARSNRTRSPSPTLIPLPAHRPAARVCLNRLRSPSPTLSSIFGDQPRRHPRAAGTVHHNAAPYSNHSYPPNAARTDNTLRAHPFQLANTLANVNSTCNQRNQQSRSDPARRTVSAESSRSGGVQLGCYGSSGSSMTVRPDTATGGRRKRNLSISSDGSVEEVRRIHGY